MLKKERKRIILEKLKTQTFVTLESLIHELKSSESTIRRDLDELEQEGECRRVHGGAERLRPLQAELTNRQKSVKNIQSKRAIAEKAVSLIENGDVIFIDPGTSTQALVDLIDNQTITVVTNSIHHAATLLSKGIRTCMIGGFVKQSTDAAVGNTAVEQIKLYNFDKVFMGINAMTQEHLTTPDIEEAAVKQAIIQQGEKVYILADESKFGWRTFVNVGSVTDITLITNQSTLPFVQSLKERTEVMEV
ncbi:DeoR/GlpR family DNA-binding transcription regulator [Tuanshanicoccus lijuaniae]|uniref:DeoR/GlpR family DNA-binding transcription regulator n=1 Tax=Aerococcaceae bacterium zg-1292 TaxID=2774330 RepID=UPI0040645DFA